MEVFYNRQRRHSSIRYEAPLPFEAMKSLGKVSTDQKQSLASSYLHWLNIAPSGRRYSGWPMISQTT
jgi:hypothetical protein